MKMLNAALLVISGVFLVAMVLMVLEGVGPKTSEGFGWTDFTAILLGAAAVVLTAVAVMVAVAAVWGYNAIHKAAIEAAEKEARIVAPKVAKEVAETVAAYEARTVLDDAGITGGGLAEAMWSAGGDNEQPDVGEDGDGGGGNEPPPRGMAG